MKQNKISLLVISTVILLSVLACNLPFAATPTPFVFPTADTTMTALFQPTNTVEIPTQAPPTITSTTAPANTSMPTNTPQPAATATKTAIPATPIPPTRRSGPVTEAQYVKNPPVLDGGWGDWIADEYAADYVVYGKSNWKNAADLSASYKVEWDEDYLYIAWKVYDDKYMQMSKGENLYEGDSVEVLIDTAVQYDYWTQWLDWDDYQIGVSPGRDEVGENVEAYLWFPSSRATSLTKTLVGVKTFAEGYRVTIGIPWSTLKLDPYTGMHLGFAASVSDDDSKKGGEQQSMVSSTWRVLTDPTTWGDLVLVK